MAECYGEKCNGKSIMANVMRHVLGDYYFEQVAHNGDNEQDIEQAGSVACNGDNERDGSVACNGDNERDGRLDSKLDSERDGSVACNGDNEQAVELDRERDGDNENAGCMWSNIIYLMDLAEVCDNIKDKIKIYTRMFNSISQEMLSRDAFRESLDKKIDELMSIPIVQKNEAFVCSMHAVRNKIALISSISKTNGESTSILSSDATKRSDGESSEKNREDLNYLV